MSLQAIVWAIEEADVDSKYLPVLLSLANHADRRGREAYPSVTTISWESRKSRAQVKKDLKAMRDKGLIRYNTELTLTHIPADRRPAVYDLVMDCKRDMTDCPVERPASGWPSEHPTRYADRELADDTPVTKHEVDTETAPGARPRAGAHTEHDRGLIQSTTGGSPTSPKPPLERATHTPGTANPDGTTEPEAQTGVCVEPEPDTALIDTLVLNLVTRAPASKQRGDDDAKRAITAKAEACVAAGATVADIDAALSGQINRETTHPINVGLKALAGLLGRLQGAQDPFAGASGTTEAPASSWVDTDGFEWPHLRADQRECGGRSCCDLGGKRYVSIIQPGLGAFSCPICKNHYKKEAAAD